jgi:lysylphosphatidylglycerol synthetase-like protein (DUF2156 family)
MSNLRPRIPWRLIITVVVLLILGAVAGPVIRSLATPEQIRDNVLLSAIPFILIFAAIVLAFIAVIAFVASLLNHNVPGSVYRAIETALIAGIVLGVVGMFQPWLQILYKYGFLLLLVSTLGFILWSHIVPRGVRRREELTSLSISDFEKHEVGGG